MKNIKSFFMRSIFVFCIFLSACHTDNGILVEPTTVSAKNKELIQKNVIEEQRNIWLDKLEKLHELDFPDTYKSLLTDLSREIQEAKTFDEPTLMKDSGFRKTVRELLYQTPVSEIQKLFGSPTNMDIDLNTGFGDPKELCLSCIEAFDKGFLGSEITAQQQQTPQNNLPACECGSWGCDWGGAAKCKSSTSCYKRRGCGFLTLGTCYGICKVFSVHDGSGF